MARAWIAWVSAPRRFLSTAFRSLWFWTRFARSATSREKATEAHWDGDAMHLIQMTETPHMTETLRINVSGMTCAACQAHVQKALEQTPGVAKAQVNLMTGEATVAFDPH